MRDRRRVPRNYKYRIYRNKINLRNNLIKYTDLFFTYFGLSIFLVLFILALPLLILDQWLSGER